jgi:tetratricopeptide (TPR) repeat protein
MRLFSENSFDRALGVHGRPKPWWSRSSVQAAALVALVVVVYARVFHAGFIWDDDVMLNPSVRSRTGLGAIWFSTQLPDYFPLTSTLLWAEWQCWGDAPIGFHLANLALHALGAVLLWRLLRRLGLPGAWLSAAVFAVHPVGVETAAWITEHKNTLAFALGAGSALAYLKFHDTRSHGQYALALGLFVAALLSKTAVVPLPVVLAILLWWIETRRPGAPSFEIRRLRPLVPFFLAAAVLAAVGMWFQAHRAIGPALVRGDGLVSRTLIAARATWFYLAHAVWPMNVAFIYPRWSLGAWQPVGFGAILAGLVVAVALWCTGRRLSGLSAAALCYAVLLLPVLGFCDISYMRHSLVADRWQYFALPAVIAPLVAGAIALLRRRDWGSTLGVPAAVAVLTLFGCRTLAYSAAFENASRLWDATLAANPDAAVAHSERGIALANSGHPAEALAEYRRALEIWPDYELAHYNLGCALSEQGDLDGAVAEFHAALRSYPQFTDAEYNLGTVQLQRGDFAAAAAAFRRVLTLEPGSAKARNNLGTALLQQGDAAAAAIEFTAVLARDPAHRGARANLGTALLQLGRPADAIEQLRRAVAGGSAAEEADVRKKLGDAWLQQGNYTDAEAEYARACALAPELVGARNNRGYALTCLHRADEAVVELEKALAQDASDPDLHNNLGNALLQLGRVPEAVSHYEAAVKLQPNDCRSHNNRGFAVWLLGREDEARAEFESALLLDPQNRSARKNLGDLLSGRRPERQPASPASNG